MPDKELEKLLTPVWQGQQALTPVYRDNEAGQPEKVAEGYEVTVPLAYTVGDKSVVWGERRLVVRSVRQAQATEAALRTRLARAQMELAALNERKKGKKRFTTEEEVWQAAAAVLGRQRVTGLVTVVVEEQVQERAVRAYGDRPAEVRVERDWQVRAQVDEQAVAKASRWFGWRVYATNALAAALPMDRAVLAYREEYVIELTTGHFFWNDEFHGTIGSKRQVRNHCERQSTTISGCSRRVAWAVSHRTERQLCQTPEYAGRIDQWHRRQQTRQPARYRR